MSISKKLDHETANQLRTIFSRLNLDSRHEYRHRYPGQRAKGRKLKTPDALIMATAIDAQLGLVSRDDDMQFIKNERNVLAVRL